MSRLFRNCILVALTVAFGVAQCLSADARLLDGDAGVPMGAGVPRLEELIRLLLRQNPELQAARMRYEAALTRPSQAGALPDPKLAAGWSSATWPAPGSGLGSEPGANLGFSVSQEFPFPGKRPLRRSIAAREAEGLANELRALELEKTADLKASYFELAFIGEARGLLRENRELLERIAAVSEARYVVGSAEQQDLIKLQIEADLLEARDVQLEAQKDALEARINALLGRGPGEALEDPEPVIEVPPLPGLDALVRSCLARSPRLRFQRSAIEARVLGVEAARKDYYPDFELMGGYYNQGEMRDMWDFRLQVNIPLYFGAKQRRGLEESNLRLAEAYRGYRAVEQDLQYRLREVHRTAEAALRLMSIYQQRLIPRSGLALESSMNRYEAGRTDFLALLSNAQSILDSEYRFLEQKTEYLKAMSRLEELVGRSAGEP